MKRVYVTVVLDCSGCKTDRRLENFSSEEFALQVAAREGWVVTDQVVYCPACVKRASKSSEEGKSSC